MFLLRVHLASPRLAAYEKTRPALLCFVFRTIIALFVMWRLSEFRRAPDGPLILSVCLRSLLTKHVGVMSFCRSMGAPETEEIMFSYSWKVEADNIRTLGKAVWQAGVGVWIDVVKLCPGDEIRPMVRTIVNRVHKVIPPTTSSLAADLFA